MKKVIYDYMTEEHAKKMVEKGKYDKTKPIMSRRSDKDLFGKPYKMYKITTIMEEVPASEIQYYFDDTDLQKKYTQKQQNAGAKLYNKKPLKITEDKEHGYNNYTREMGWHELGAKTKEKYILEVESLYDSDEDAWP